MLPDEDWAARAAASASGHSSKGFFAVHGKETCGLVWCVLSDIEPQIAHIYQMWAAPTVRGQGAGRALLTQSIAWAKSKGAHHIRLSVTADESPAMRLYKSHGFYPAGDAGLLRQGSDLRAQGMELKLEVDA